MSKLTLEVSEETIRRLEAAAHRKNVSPAELACSILNRALPATEDEIREGKRVLPEIPTWGSGDPFLARNVDEILAAEWPAAIERHR